VYERNGYIGGRSTTVNVYDDPNQPVELGASIFVEVNYNLVNATRNFNLSTSTPDEESTADGPRLGIWNGNTFVYKQSGSNSYWDVAKLFWKYGLAPYKTLKLMKSTTARFFQMYDHPHFPFASLSETVYALGLTAVTAATGEQYLNENGISAAFANDIIQASTRVNYAQNLSSIHGLETMVCMATEGAMSVKGGNWQIFSEMLKASGAHVYLTRAVSTVNRNSDNGKFVVHSPLRRDNVYQDSILEDLEFDEVVLAAPEQFASIDFNTGSDLKIDDIPYVQLFVTLFTTRHSLSPAAFNMRPDEVVPRTVLTTLPQRNGEGAPDFFSISLLRSTVDTRFHSAPTEYLYKIFSHAPLTDAFLAKILGFDPERDVNEENISWMYEKRWNSYPYEYPRITFEKIKLDDGLWYTSGIESFISTMETSSLMGSNVAKLIVNEWVEKRSRMMA